MENNIQFRPSHYDKCIGKYQVDLHNCMVNCLYCGLRGQRERSDALLETKPKDIKEKGVYLSPNSDPFALFVQDRTYELLQQLLPMGVPVLIITKSYIPKQTIALLAQYPSQVYVQISISRLDDKLNRIIEPFAASSTVRLDVINSLVEAGIRVTPVLMPLFPGLDDKKTSLYWLVHHCAEAGAKYLKAAYVVLRPSLIVQLQSKKHTRLNKSLAQLTESVQIHIGGGLTVPVERRIATYTMLTQICSAHRIKFQTCPILDPAVLTMNDVALCGTYKKKKLKK